MANFTKKPVFGSKHRFIYTCNDCFKHCSRIDNNDAKLKCPLSECLDSNGHKFEPMIVGSINTGMKECVYCSIVVRADS